MATEHRRSICLLGYFRRRSIANGNPVTAPCATELLTTTRSELSPITCPLTETSSAFTCTSNPREDYKPQVLSVLALAALESHAVFSSLFTVNILLSVSTEHSSGLKRDRKNDTARKHNLDLPQNFQSKRCKDPPVRLEKSKADVQAPRAESVGRLVCRPSSISPISVGPSTVILAAQANHNITRSLGSPRGKGLASAVNTTVCVYTITQTRASFPGQNFFDVWDRWMDGSTHALKLVW